MSKPTLTASWIAQILIAGIYLMTLFFKFTYAEDTQAIFGDIGGRPAATLVGVMELATVVLLLVPRTAVYGLLASLGVIGGAIFTHVALIGIQVPSVDGTTTDGGSTFMMAVAVLVLTLVGLALRRSQLPVFGERFAGSVTLA